MNEYIFDDIPLGMTASFQREVTLEMEETFCTLTGDENPLHRDDIFAQKMGKFSSHVTFGMLTASLCSTLAGVYLPGKYSLIHSFDELSFLKPVYAGDLLTVTGEVEERVEALRLLRLKVHIQNQHGQKVARAGMKVLVLR